jgi:polyisoprenoid-binding protein YceI
MHTLIITLLTGLFLFTGPAPTPTASAPSPTVTVETPTERATYAIDVVHSEMTFRIRHLMGRVFGTFTDWEGSFTVNPADVSTLDAVSVTVRTESINTLNEQRDDHLRTDDFFDVANHPTMTFSSNRVVVNGRAVAIEGDLTIRGTTRPVVLTGEYLGEGADPWGGERVAFVASTVVDRQDFGVSFNQLVEGVGMIGNQVEISLAVQGVRQ